MKPSILPRQRVAPKRLDDRPSTAYFPSTPKENYRRIYFAAIDQIISSIDERFNAETYKILSKLKDYATNKCDFDDIQEYLYKDGSCAEAPTLI